MSRLSREASEPTIDTCIEVLDIPFRGDWTGLCHLPLTSDGRHYLFWLFDRLIVWSLWLFDRWMITGWCEGVHTPDFIGAVCPTKEKSITGPSRSIYQCPPLFHHVGGASVWFFFASPHQQSTCPLLAVFHTSFPKSKYYEIKQRVGHSCRLLRRAFLTHPLCCSCL